MIILDLSVFRCQTLEVSLSLSLSLSIYIYIYIYRQLSVTERRRNRSIDVATDIIGVPGRFMVLVKYKLSSTL